MNGDEFKLFNSSIFRSIIIAHNATSLKSNKAHLLTLNRVIVMQIFHETISLVIDPFANEHRFQLKSTIMNPSRWKNNKHAERQREEKEKMLVKGGVNYIARADLDIMLRAGHLSSS